MTESSDTQLRSIDHAILTPMVRRALGSETVEVTDWDCQPIHSGGQASSAVYRLSGNGRDQGERTSWSLILKTVHPPPDTNDPSHWDYWKREVLAYQSGLLDDLPGGLAAPRCFGVSERPGGEFWLWLEDVGEDIGLEWPLEHYGIVARHLGQFNGAYLTGRPLPRWPWLGKGWLRGWLSPVAEVIDQLPSALEHPLGRRWLPGDNCEALMHLWDTREAFLEALDRLPQTFCHRDAFRRNLFARRGGEGDYETVAIDWAWLGSGAVGEEIIPLVQATLYFREMEFAQARALDHVVFEGYLDGLRDTGWRGDPRKVRLGFTAGTVRYALATIGFVVTVLRDEEQYAFWEGVIGCPLEEYVDEFSEFTHFELDLLAEARELMELVA